MQQPIGILVLDPDQKQAARALAEKLKIPMLDHPPAGEHLLLELGTSVLDLVLTRPRQVLRMHVDFGANSIQRRIASGGVTREALVKAVGASRQTNLRVLDATAGLGRDSLLLAAAQCRVTAAESNPFVAALLEDGLRRGLAHGLPETRVWLQRIELQCREATRLMGDPSRCVPDVIYLDPMFALPNRRALAKKPMQLLDLMADRGDPNTLFAQAIQTARARVVVKRALKAPSLGTRKPTFKLPGHSCRFDVYSLAAL